MPDILPQAASPHPAPGLPGTAAASLRQVVAIFFGPEFTL